MINFSDITDPGKLSSDDMPFIQAVLAIFDAMPYGSTIYSQEICEQIGVEHNTINKQKITNVKKIAFVDFGWQIHGNSNGFNKVNPNNREKRIEHLKSWIKRYQSSRLMINSEYKRLSNNDKNLIPDIDFDMMIENIPQREDGIM